MKVEVYAVLSRGGMSMKYPALAVITVAFALAVLSPESALAGPYLAGPYGDELAKCLVKSTTDADKTYLVKWLFAAAALHPDVKSIASVSDAQRDELNKNAAKLFERLLTESCRSETQEAVKYEGPSTLESSFNALGQVAARGLFSHPTVARGTGELTNYVDKQKLERVFRPTK